MMEQVREMAALLIYSRAKRKAVDPGSLPPPIPDADTDASLAAYVASQYKGRGLTELNEQELTTVLESLQEIATREEGR